MNKESIPESGNILKDSYMPQLDSLRAVAVFLVLFEHWIPSGETPNFLPYGMIGVTMFFVLSGFLITQILIRSKEYSLQNNSGIFHSLKQFYARRTLRIFPIYYITIFILLIFNIQNIKDKFLWFLFYASNILFFRMKEWEGPLSHLWTLSVEEQFYIFWPLVILLTPKKYLLRTIFVFTLFGPIFRTLLFTFHQGTESASYFIHILTPSCLDCFGLGAVLAYYTTYRVDTNGIKKIWILLFLFYNIFSFIIFMFFYDNIVNVLIISNISVISMIIIAKMSTGFQGRLKKVFENKSLMYLGKISYGMYLYHNFIPLIYNYLKLPYIKNTFLNFIIQFCLLLLLSSISWYLIEKPVNGLKKYFAYN